MSDADRPEPQCYERVLPRDLFNEANLLKCWGQIALHTLDHPMIKIDHKPYLGNVGFVVYQNDYDGSLEVVNLRLTIGNVFYRVFRPLNARDPYPLMLEIDKDTDEHINVFTDSGEFSESFNRLVRIAYDLHH